MPNVYELVSMNVLGPSMEASYHRFCFCGCLVLSRVVVGN
jgi:hypothetical protein